MKYTIGIDVGTSGTKTVLFDTTGKKIASHTVEYPMYQPKNASNIQIMRLVILVFLSIYIFLFPGSAFCCPYPYLKYLTAFSNIPK